MSGAIKRISCGIAALLLVPAAFAEPQAESPPLVFVFHSGFWVNLHHFLYQQARIRHREPIPRQVQRNGSVGTQDAPALADALPTDEQKDWARALDYYATDLARRDLLFNSEMVRIKNRLADLESCEDVSGIRSRDCISGLRPEHISALEGAAPVYRRRWWPEHDRANRAWIAGVAPLVLQFGGELAQQLSATYHSAWPSGRIHVEVVSYSGPFGAYTTLDPVRVTISGSDTRNQGPGALEVLFHEGSHALAREIRDAIVRECRARGKPIPRDLWHALLFYTTGEIVRRALNDREGTFARTPQALDAPQEPASARYTPYAYRHGLYARGWENYQRLLERYWQPYLQGKVDFETAVARIVSNL